MEIHTADDIPIDGSIVLISQPRFLAVARSMLASAYQEWIWPGSNVKPKYLLIERDP